MACSILKKDGWTARFDPGYSVLENCMMVVNHRLDLPRDTFTEEMEGKRSKRASCEDRNHAWAADRRFAGFCDELLGPNQY